MRAKEFVTEISRRDLLKGAAGAGLAAGAGIGAYMVGKNLVKKPELEPEQEPQLKPPSPISKNPEYESLILRAAKSVSPAIEGIELAAFLAQCYHESAGFTAMREYGGPKRFKKLYDIANNPRLAKILGNLHVGDGIRYHGRGFIQLTGRANYKAAGAALGKDLEGHPELAMDPATAAKIAAWYWIKRVRPYVSDFSDVSAVTRKINAKLEGLSSRESAFQQYLKTMK